MLDPGGLARNVAAFARPFRQHYARTQLAYPYKANHLPAVCRQMADLGLAAEVCSPMELWLARQLGVPDDLIVYNGAGRPHQSLADALLAGVIVNLDSARDLDIAARVARAHPGRQFAVGLRCTFPIPGRDGSRFGVPVDEPQFSEALTAVRAAPGLFLAGMHCHMPGPELPLFEHRARRMVSAARLAFPDTPPDYLDLGGGFYGGVPTSDRGPSPADYAAVLCPPIVSAFGLGATGPRLIVEPGTALVATTMSYVTRVVDVKRWNGHTVAMVDGSLLDTSPNRRRTDFPVTVIAPVAREGSGSFDVAGGTPMPDEYLALGLPGDIVAGDFLRFDNVGAYTISMTTTFVAPRPAVVEANPDGGWHTVVPAGTPEQVFRDRL